MDNIQLFSGDKLAYSPHVLEDPKPLPVSMDAAEDFMSDVAEGLTEHLLSAGYDAMPEDELKDLLREVFVGLVRLRILQISRARKSPSYRWIDVHVPSLLFPLLAQLGEYKNEARGIHLVPTLHNHATGETLVLSDAEQLAIVKKAETVARSLSRWGIGYSMGLPKETVTDTDVLFTLAKVDSNTQVVAGSDEVPNPVALMLRAALQFSKLSEIYGEPRIVYCAMTILKRLYVDAIGSRVNHPSAVKT